MVDLAQEQQVAAIHEHCSVCDRQFEVMFRYQMEERDGGFVFFCTHRCLQRSHSPAEAVETVTCDGCGKRFGITLASQVLYTAGQRRYACSMACRSQLVQEAEGRRLGEIAAAEAPEPAPAPAPAPAVVAVAAGGDQATGASDSHRQQRQRSQSAARATSPRPRRIAVFNHKGGTGKTTTAVSLAAGLAERGHRVLLVDTDAQGNVAVSLDAGTQRSLYHVLVMGLRFSAAVQTVRPGLDLLPANETLAAAELYLAGRQNRHQVLSQRLAPADSAYDYVVIDCSPSLSLMNQNALIFADSVLVPVACDYLSLVGVRQVLKTVKHVNNLLHHPVRIWGVLPTFYDSRAKICNEALDTLKDHFGGLCLQPIRSTIKLKEAPANGVTIFEHAPSAHGAEDYRALVERLLSETAPSATHPRSHARPAPGSFPGASKRKSSSHAGHNTGVHRP